MTSVWSATRKIFYWPVALFVLTLVIIAFGFKLTAFKAEYLSVTPELRSHTVSSRFANAPECFAYKDPITDKVHARTIDITKFNEERMNEACYATNPKGGEKDLNFELKLQRNGEVVETNKYAKVPHLEKRIPVKVRRDNRIEDDILIVKTQISIPYKQRG